MTTPEPDYPAAHSMDTSWYAVDADGHVGVFHSGEEGAVPDEVGIDHAIPGTGSLEDALPEAPFRLLDWLGEDRQEHHVELPPRRSRKGLGKILLFLGSLDPVRKEVEAHQAEHAEASEGVAVLFHDLPVATAWRLHEAGACLGCFPWASGDEYYDLDDDRARRLGLFRYCHDEAGMATVYLRSRPPDRPVRIEEIPPGLREVVGRLRFADLRFAEAQAIQPVGLVPCSAWGDAYLDPDGVTVRPIPGQEDRFDARAWANVPGFRVEVPDRPTPPGPEPHPPAE